MSLMPAFDRKPECGIIIGRLLISYGELEYEWMTCLGTALGDLLTAVRVMYRMRSEGNRVEIGDAILRPYYAKLSLGETYEQAFGALNRCKQIRNNFAHSHWADNDLGLFYTAMEDAAKPRVGDGLLSFSHIDEPLLKRQEELFHYCRDLLWYLNGEAEVKTGKKKNHPHRLPQVLSLPPLCNPKETAPRYSPDS